MDANILTVRHNGRIGTAKLNDDVAAENWPAEAWLDYPDATLDDEGSEALAEAVYGIVHDWPSHPWPTCVVHREALTVCSMTWCCSGPPEHDVASLGELRPHHPRST